jgi:hypothetical protein
MTTIKPQDVTPAEYKKALQAAYPDAEVGKNIPAAGWALGVEFKAPNDWNGGGTKGHTKNKGNSKKDTHSSGAAGRWDTFASAVKTAFRDKAKNNKSLGQFKNWAAAQAEDLGL